MSVYRIETVADGYGDITMLYPCGAVPREDMVPAEPRWLLV